MEANGIIVKEVELSTGKRLINILTDDFGLITAIINCGRLGKSGKFSSLHVLMYCRFVLFKRKDYYHVDEFDILNVFWGIKDDLKSLAVCQYFCELCMSLNPENTVSKDFLKLFLNSVFYISKRTKDLKLIKIIFEMKALSLCGYMPNLIGCCRCGEYNNDTMLFLIDSGTIVCGNCCQNLNINLSVKVTKGMVYALRHVVYSTIEKVFSFELSDNALKVLSELSESYMKYHLDTNFKSLEFYNRL